MIEQSVSLASNGVVKVPGYEQLVRFGYTKNKGVYRLAVTPTGEWEGLTIRAFWHVPDSKNPASSLVADGYVAVPASVTAQPGNGCITFEGSDGTKTVTSADLRYRVSANSGTADGTMPEPGTPAWQQLVDAVHTDATAVEQAKTDAQTAAQQAGASAKKAGQSAKQAAGSLQELKDCIASGDFKGEKGDPGPIGPVGPQGEVGPEGPAGKDGVQIDDVAVSEDAPWSSKHIIDMLCPPLEESGNPVVCYPVAGYSLGVKASWEPVQEGSGTPSQENIRPIKGRANVMVERCGENLLDVAQCRPASLASAYGLTVTVDDTGLIRVFGTPNVDKDIPQATFRILFTNQVILTKKYEAKWFVVKGVANSITRIQSDKSIVLQSPLSPNTPVDIQFRFMYYTGTTAPTTYTPYIGQTTTLTLPETVYGGEVDAVSGEGRKTWKMLTLDGTEKWGSELTKNPGKVGFTFQVPEIATPTSPELKGGIVCNQYPTVSANDTYSCKNGISVEAQAHTYFRIYNDTYAGGTTDEWKAYLAAQNAAGTPVQVAYKLATPTPFTATGAQPISALAGVNTVLTDADSATVTGRADPVKRITDLEDAVASQT